MSRHLEPRSPVVHSTALFDDEGSKRPTQTATLAEFLSTTGPEDIFRPYRTLQHRKSAVALRLRSKQASISSAKQPPIETADNSRLIPQTTKAGKHYFAIKAYNEASTLHTPGDTTEIAKVASPQLQEANELPSAVSVAVMEPKVLPRRHLDLAGEAPDDLFSDNAPPHARSDVRPSPASMHSMSTTWSEPVAYNESYQAYHAHRRLASDDSRFSRSVSREMHRASFASSRSDISLAQSLQMLKSMSEDDDDDEYVPPSVVFIGRRSNPTASNRSSSSSMESIAGERLRRLRSNSIPRNRLSRDSSSSVESDYPKVAPPPARRIPSHPEDHTPVLANTTLTPVYESSAWPLVDSVEKDVLETRVKTLEDRNRDLEQALRSLLESRDAQDKDKLLRDLLARSEQATMT